MTELQVTKQ